MSQAQHERLGEGTSADINCRSLDGGGPRSDSTELERRIDLVKVYAFPHSPVYILVGLTSKIFEKIVISEVRSLLDSALAFAMVASEEIGYERLIPGGMFSRGKSPKLTVWNANNHQVTWNTLHDTLLALLKFLEDNNYGSADFAVYDDKNKVGEGVLTTY